MLTNFCLTHPFDFHYNQIFMLRNMQQRFLEEVLNIKLICVVAVIAA